MRRYETIFILRPNLSEEQINTIIDNTKKIIQDDQGTIIALSKWGVKKLAYSIKKEIMGNYIYCDYAGTPAAVAEIERKFRIDDAVLKYLSIKTADTISAGNIEIAIAEAEKKLAAAAASEEEERDFSVDLLEEHETVDEE